MKTIVYVLSLFIALSLASCGDSEPKQPDTNTEKPKPTAQTLPTKSPLQGTTEKLLKKAFPEYKKVKMDPLDAFPIFQSTAETAYFRLQRKSPVPNKINRQAFPRIILKAYSFRTPKELHNEATAWLNTMEASSDVLVLGEGVDKVKSPPLLCGIVNLQFFIVQAACIYDGPEWQSNVDRFFAEMKAAQAEYAWQIKCDGGELTYEIRPVE